LVSNAYFSEQQDIGFCMSMINWVVIAFVLIGYGVSMSPFYKRNALIADVRTFWCRSILVGFIFGLLAYISASSAESVG
jgi:uncharacterized Tic20 family protein